MCICDLQRDLFCKLCDRKQQLCLCNRKERIGREEGLVCDRQERHCDNFDYKFLCCCRSCSFCKRVSAKERCKSQLLLSVSRNKACERCFLCRSVEFCKKCHKCPNCCSRSACRGQITPVLEKIGPCPLPVPAKIDQVTHHNKLLCKSTQEPLLVGAIASTVEQKCSRVGQKPRISGLLQPTILFTKTQQPMETYLGPKYPEQIFYIKTESFKIETLETLKISLQAGEWVSKRYTSTYQYTASPGSTCISTSRVSPTNSKHYHLACPQLRWN